MFEFFKRKPVAKFREEVDPRTGEVHQVMIQDELGREIPDPVPLAPPVGYHKQESLFTLVRDMVRSEALRREALAQGYESFEEADDFNVLDEEGEGPDPRTPYENDFDPSIRELSLAGQQELERKAQAAQKPPAGKPKQPKGKSGANPPSDGHLADPNEEPDDA